MARSGGLKRGAPWLLAALVSLGAIGAAVLGWDTDEFELTGAVTGVAFLFAIVLISILGALLRTRAPDNPIGALFMLTGFGMLAASASGGSVDAVDPTWLDYLSLVMSEPGALLMFYPFILMLYIFPTGRFHSRWWSWAGWYGYIALPLAVLFALFAESWTVTDLGNEGTQTVANPIGFLPIGLVDAIGFWMFPGLAIVALGAIPAIIIRYRRASLVERTQLRWLLWSGTSFAVALLLITTGATGSDTLLFSITLIAPFVMVPLALTFAITRYRLFEIDRVISRTVTYLLVAGLLALVFVAGAVWLPATVLGESPPLFVAASTLAVAALFNPLRLRIQRIVDRRFNRSAYQAEVLAENFGASLQQSLTVDDVAGRWVETVESALEPQSVGLWLSPRDRG